MGKYIDKDALLERIKKLKMDIGNIFNEYDEGFWEGRSTAFDNVICAIDTLEVKEVDLDREIEKEIETRWRGEYLFTSKFRESAKYFFELGMSVSNKAQKGEEV